MQIDWMQFLTQVAGLCAWIMLAAAVYALVENQLDQRDARKSRGP